MAFCNAEITVANPDFRIEFRFWLNDAFYQSRKKPTLNGR